MSFFEDDFLERLARGLIIEPDEYNQVVQDLPKEALALAFSRRFWITRETQALVQAAYLYNHAGMTYEALEVCSRASRSSELQKIKQRALGQARQEYPGIQWIGKLLDEAFLVIDLVSGQIIRFPPIIPCHPERRVRAADMQIDISSSLHYNSQTEIT